MKKNVFPMLVLAMSIVFILFTDNNSSLAFAEESPLTQSIEVEKFEDGRVFL